MLRVEVHAAKTGMPLALPVMNPQSRGQTLLRSGYELTDSAIGRLKDLNIKDVWIKYPALSHLEQFIDARRLENQAQVVESITSAFEAIQAKSAPKLKYDTYVAAVEAMIDDLVSHPKAMVFLGDLIGIDDPLLKRSAEVTYLAVMMGLRLEGHLVRERRRVNAARAKEVTNLGIGAMLHDIGVTLLPEDVRLRYAKTGDTHDADWREHPAVGFRAVRGQIEPTAATVVLHHHQQFDGKGFAGAEFPKLAGPAIHIFARITHVAATFTQLLHPACSEPPPTVWVLASMLSAPANQRFDPEVLRALIQVCPPYPPGSIVELSDTRRAVVLDHNPANPCRPVVQPLPPGDFLDRGALDTMPDPPIDLAAHNRALTIVKADGHDVSEFNFGPEKIPGAMVFAA